MEETLPLNASGDGGANRMWSGELNFESASDRNGSIVSSAGNLAGCAFGASMLSLPYAMFIAGPIPALVFLTAFGVMAYMTAQAVLRAGVASQKSNYTTIVRHYFGNFQGSLAEILLSVALIVAAISYVVGLADLLPVGFAPFLSIVSHIFYRVEIKQIHFLTHEFRI